MIKSRDYNDIMEAVVMRSKTVLLFTADWCGDCQYLYPLLEEIEAENSAFNFMQVDRDDFMDLAQKWDVFGILSLIVTENGQEIGRFVDKNSKMKEEIRAFLKGL